jgi:hypothetical protein
MIYLNQETLPSCPCGSCGRRPSITATFLYSGPLMLYLRHSKIKERGLPYEKIISYADASWVGVRRLLNL